MSDAPPALLPWLSDRLARESGAPVADLSLSDPARPEAGQSNDTVFTTARWSTSSGPRSRHLVVRRQPSGHQIFLTADVVREARVLVGLENAVGVPVPHVLGIEPDPSVLGRPFFVMDRVEGYVPLARPSIHLVGQLTELTPLERRTLWDSALDVVVAVHAVDWRSTHGFLLDGGGIDAVLHRHVDRLVEWYRWTTKGRVFPIIDAGVERLLAERATIAIDEPVLVWGDARVGNMIFGADHRVVAAIDWEVATIGSPALDLAHWLFFDEFATGASGVPRLEGWPDRETTIVEYERRAGRTLAHLDYFELMDEVFMATTLIRQADFRVDRGEAGPDTRMGADNAVTQMLARRLGLPVPELSPDYLAHRGLPR